MANSNPNQNLNSDAKYNGRVFFEENEYIPGYQLFDGSNQPQQCFQNSISNIQDPIIGSDTSATRVDEFLLPTCVNMTVKVSSENGTVELFR